VALAVMSNMCACPRPFPLQDRLLLATSPSTSYSISLTCLRTDGRTHINVVFRFTNGNLSSTFSRSDRTNDTSLSALQPRYIVEPPTTGKVVLTTDCGDIDIELWCKECPKACRNFIQLCQEGCVRAFAFAMQQLTLSHQHCSRAVASHRQLTTQLGQHFKTRA
jgi:hypothetical protein